MKRVAAAWVVVWSSFAVWGADPAKPTPAQDMKTAQGRWQFDPKSGILFGIDKPGHLWSH